MIAGLTGGFAAFRAILAGREPPPGAIDTSFDGFWRSFLAIIFIVPAVILLGASQELGRPDLDAGVAAALVQLSLEWALYPLALVPFARVFDLGPRFVPFVATYNWLAPALTVPFIVVAVLHLTGVLSNEAVPFLYLLATAFAFLMRFRLARIVFKAGPLAAVASVVLDILVSLAVSAALDAVTR